MPSGEEVRFVVRTDMEGGKRLSWSLVGKSGAIEAWCRDTPKYRALNYDMGGIEMHAAAEPEGWYGDGPSHDDCTILDGRACWHDGSSLAWEENGLGDALRRCGYDAHDKGFCDQVQFVLWRWYRNQFGVIPNVVNEKDPTNA